MSYGKIVFGKVEFEIRYMCLARGVMRLDCRATPKLKHLRELPDHGLMPYAIYGEDGELIAVGTQPASIFDEARKYGCCLDNVYLDFPIHLVSPLGMAR